MPNIDAIAKPDFWSFLILLSHGHHHSVCFARWTPRECLLSKFTPAGFDRCNLTLRYNRSTMYARAGLEKIQLHSTTFTRQARISQPTVISWKRSSTFWEVENWFSGSIVYWKIDEIYRKSGMPILSRWSWRAQNRILLEQISCGLRTCFTDIFSSWRVSYPVQ